MSNWYFVNYTYGPWDDNFHCAIMTDEMLKEWCARRAEYCNKYNSGTLADKSDFSACLITNEEAHTLNKWLFNFENWKTSNFPMYEGEIE